MIIMIMIKFLSVVIFSEDAICKHIASLDKRTNPRITEFSMNSHA